MVSKILACIEVLDHFINSFNKTKTNTLIVSTAKTTLNYIDKVVNNG